ncbi:hypothetical protein OSTOST_16671 [Ostertagia ostertagi]
MSEYHSARMKIFFVLLLSVWILASECAIWRSAPRFPRNPPDSLHQVNTMYSGPIYDSSIWKERKGPKGPKEPEQVTFNV